MVAGGLRKDRVLKADVRLNVEIVPFLQARFSFRFGGRGEILEERGGEYVEPRTTDARLVELVYGEKREYGFPRTTDGY